MPHELPAACHELLALQCGVISRWQALRSGMPETMIGGRLRLGAWQQLHPGVYATFTGEPPRPAMLWAAVLRAGSGAALSHQSAAELFQLTGTPSSLVHVTVPADRRVRGAAGLGIITLRYNWADVIERACDVAAEIAIVLQQRGWAGRPRSCGRRCRTTLS